jgi:hypothetical protein
LPAFTKRIIQQNAVIAALLTQPSIGRAAVACGVNEKSIRTWLRERAFRKRYEAAQHEVLAVAIGALHEATGHAVETLIRHLDSRGPAGVQVRAALGLLGCALKANEVLDLRTRLEELERRLAEREELERR